MSNQNQLQKQSALSQLKPKEKEFVIRYVENGFNGSKSYREVFVDQDPEKANIRAYKLLQLPYILDAIEEQKELQTITLRDALLREGITPQKIAKKVGVLLEAEKPVYEKNEDGEYEEAGTEVDFTAVDKGLKHALAIHGVEEGQGVRTVTNVNFFFARPELKKKIENMEAEIKQELLNDVE